MFWGRGSTGTCGCPLLPPIAPRAASLLPWRVSGAVSRTKAPRREPAVQMLRLADDDLSIVTALLKRQC
jgi:hypothetical protein